MPKRIPFWYHQEQSLISSGLCQKNADLDAQDISIVSFSYMLRLQLVVSSSNWCNKGVKRSVDQFFERLIKSDTVETLDDDSLVDLANATIFIAMRPIRAERGTRQQKTPRDVESEEAQDLADERETQKKHISDALSVLVALMRKRPDMGLPVLRQTSWGIWVLSRPITRSLSELLVPTVISSGALVPTLAGLLSPKLERNSMSDAILVLITYLLRSGLEACSEEADTVEVQFLRSELMGSYLHYLQRSVDEMKSVMRV